MYLCGTPRPWRLDSARHDRCLRTCKQHFPTLPAGSNQRSLKASTRSVKQPQRLPTSCLLSAACQPPHSTFCPCHSQVGKQRPDPSRCCSQLALAHHPIDSQKTEPPCQLAFCARHCCLFLADGPSAPFASARPMKQCAVSLKALCSAFKATSIAGISWFSSMVIWLSEDSVQSCAFYTAPCDGKYVHGTRAWPPRTSVWDSPCNQHPSAPTQAAQQSQR